MLGWKKGCARSRFRDQGLNRSDYKKPQNRNRAANCISLGGMALTA